MVKTKSKKSAKPAKNRGLGDPFEPIKAHKMIEIPKYRAFPFHKFAWSRDGQWCVGVGHAGFVNSADKLFMDKITDWSMIRRLINIFHRWKDGAPPYDENLQTPPTRDQGPQIS